MLDERLAARMRELDEQLASIEPPPRLERRILGSIAEPRPAPRMLVLAGAAVAVVLAFWLGSRMRAEPQDRVVVVERDVAAPAPPSRAPQVEPERAQPSSTRWDGTLAIADDCDVEGGSELAIGGACRLHARAPELTIDVWAPTRIARAKNGVRVLDGELSFAVAKVAEGEPRVRVEVSAGAIEVIGTRFSVVQHGDEGHVDLTEGAIVFVDHAGTSHAVEAGRRLRWTGAGVVATPRSREPVRTSAAPATKADDRLDDTLEQVAALRRAERWADAIALLHRARRDLTEPAAAEILSYEEGTLRAHRDDGPALCAYWRGHVARFGEGVHAPSARSQLARAGCDAP